MSLDILNPPAPHVSASRLTVRREHLLAEIRRESAQGSRLRRWFMIQSRARRLVLIVALVLLVSGVGTAIGVGVDLLTRDVAFHKLDRGQLSPRPLGSFVYITRGSDWALIAWKSSRGICLDYAYDDKTSSTGFTGWSGCGFPVVGSPRDREVQQPPNTDVVGVLIGRQGRDGPWAISGPVSSNVAKVAVEFQDGHVSTAGIYGAPGKLHTRLRFYLLREGGGAHAPTSKTHGRPLSPVRAVAAYDKAGKLLQRKVLS